MQYDHELCHPVSYTILSSAVAVSKALINLTGKREGNWVYWQGSKWDSTLGRWMRGKKRPVSRAQRGRGVSR